MELKPNRFDVRVLRRPNLQPNRVTREELDAHLAALPDEAENAERVSTVLSPSTRRVDVSDHVPVPVSSGVSEDN